MDSPAELFVTRVTRPLAGSEELQLAADAMLRERLAEPGAGEPAALAAATAALERADARPSGPRWRKWLKVITLVVSLPLLAVMVMKFASAVALIQGLAPKNVGKPPVVARLAKGLNPAERLLLVGAPDARSEADRWQPLWASQPDKPAYLAEFALASLSSHHELSPDILAAAERIDPGNGWFPALAAAGKAEGVLKKGTRTSREKREGKAIAWEIFDEPLLRESLLQLHAAAGKPQFSGYRNELHAERVRLLPPRVDWLSQVAWQTFMIGSNNTAAIDFARLGDAIAAGAEQCAARQDPDGFRQILIDWRWLTRAVTAHEDTLIGQLVARMLATSPLANFRDAARTLGMEAEATQFAKAEQQDRDERELRDRERSRTELANRALVHDRGSLLGSLTMITSSVSRSSPLLTEADLRPGRMVDHAVFDWVSAVVIWSILSFGVAGVSSTYWGRLPIRKVAARKVAARLVELLGQRDWAWILLGGVVAPVVWYLAVTRLTPLGAREWSLASSGFLLPIGQKCALALLLVGLPLVLAEWRLGLRGACLGLTTRRAWLGWLAVAAAALAIPGLGAVVSGPDWWPKTLVTVLLGGPACWLVGVVLLSTNGAETHDLRRATVARVAVPGWLFSMLLCALALPLHHSEERRWLAQDELLAIPVDRPVSSGYEAKLVPLVRAETLTLLEGL